MWQSTSTEAVNKSKPFIYIYRPILVDQTEIVPSLTVSSWAKKPKIPENFSSPHHLLLRSMSASEHYHILFFILFFFFFWRKTYQSAWEVMSYDLCSDMSASTFKEFDYGFHCLHQASMNPWPYVQLWVLYSCLSFCCPFKTISMILSCIIILMGKPIYKQNKVFFQAITQRLGDPHSEL